MAVAEDRETDAESSRAATASPAKQVVSIDGHRLTITNLDKVMYPATGTTKGDVLHYYATVAPVLIPHTQDRPVTRKRWVNGVDGEMFFQKNLADSTPSWVKRRTIQHKDHRNEYPLVNDLATLTWLAQIATLEFHVPQWTFGRNGQPRNPDRLVLDLDPGDGIGVLECAEVARFARDILREMGLDPYPVTSGSKGIHLYAALDGKQDSDAVSAVAHELARALEADHRDLVVSDMKKAIRGGKVFVDWSQNNANKTTITPYSLRGRDHPMVATPRTWDELDDPHLEHLDFEEVMDRVANHGDLLAGLDDGIKRHADDRDRLTIYRGKRDANKTPEPVPADHPDETGGNFFVIQEHHARRLHWDFRLERDGVLVSWALPRGVPVERNKNHLAVHVEDHPLEYGGFEGTIPKGEYGAGEVTIWDAGDYELEKWREGKEVIVTLHGEDGGGLGGSKMFALIHTGGEGKDDNNWLIHLMDPAHRSAAYHRYAPKKSSPLGQNVAEPRSGASVPESERIEPMFAALGTEKDIENSSDWVFEMKWDGIRAIARITEGKLRLISRRGVDVTDRYPELADLPDHVTGDAVLDGEIVALSKSGRPDFGLLQNRMNLVQPGEIERARKVTPVHYMLFDLLEHGGRSLMPLDYEQRRAELEAAVTTTQSGTVQVPPAFEGDIEHAMESSRQLGLEGVVAKRRDSRYRPGSRTSAWTKLKHHSTQEVIIGGWREGKGRRAGGVGSLLLGVNDGDQLRYIGRVGTGFTDKQLDELDRLVKKHARQTNPLADVPAIDTRDAHWVTPTLVGEVEFAEWTGDGHLRQPSWRGWRPDKSAAEVVRES
jgi:bifunctional non-homologous end joining protein LigD